MINKNTWKKNLKRFGINDYITLGTSLDSNKKLLRNMNPQIYEEIEAMKVVLYQIIVGILLYVIIGT